MSFPTHYLQALLLILTVKSYKILKIWFKNSQGSTRLTMKHTPITLHLSVKTQSPMTGIYPRFY
ncbi:hypothetical protein HanPI659440_Chr13g0511271 [Helianthus annuus]|nr:hypothetical protein HanPI659440_Chr13g0511271 [Helianthus annuus]